MDSKLLIYAAILVSFLSLLAVYIVGYTHLENEKNLYSVNMYEVFGILCITIFVLLSFIFYRLLKQIGRKEQLLAENKVFSDIINNTFDLILIYDRDLKVTYCNQATLDKYHLKKEDIIGKISAEVFRSRYTKEEIAIRFESLKRDGFLITERKDTDTLGNHLELQTTMNAIRDDHGNTVGYFAIITDITQLKQANARVEQLAASLTTVNDGLEEKVREQTRFYKCISEVNDLVLHAANPNQMYEELCRIVIETGKMRFAWVGILNEETQSVIPVAWDGVNDGYLDFISGHSLLKLPAAKGPTGRAYLQGKAYYCNDIATDPAMEPWRMEAMQRGYYSSIAIPIKVDETVIAVFTVYATRAHFFKEDEVSLLVRVCGNIAYALKSLQNEENRQEAVKQLNKITQVVKQNTIPVIITDLQGKIEYANPAYSMINGLSTEECIGTVPQILKPGFLKDKEWLSLSTAIENQKEWQGIFSSQQNGGAIYWDKIILSPIINEIGKTINYAIKIENITEKVRMEQRQQLMVNIIENSAAFVAFSDINRNLIYGNQSIKDKLGISNKDITHYNVNDFRSAKGDQLYPEINAQLMESGKWAGENYYKSINGTEIPVLQVMMLHKDKDGNPDMISTTGIDLTNIKAAENDLRKATDELRDFAWHLQNIREIEKKDIAREIHDELGQELTAIRFDISWLKKHIGDDRNLLENKIDELTENIKTTMDAFRRIQSSLNPVLLEKSGLYPALESLVCSFKKTSNLPVTFISNLENETIAFEKGLVLYRVIQESLTNVLRYASATEVVLEIQKQGEVILLDISDNGIGFDSAAVDTKLHHGILGMRERVYAVKGSFSIQSTIQEGTYIHVEVPLAS